MSPSNNNTLCFQCGKTFARPPDLRKHLKKIHLFEPLAVKNIVPRKKKEGSFKYNCNHSQCQKSFNSLPHFKAHLKVHEEKETNEGSVRKCPLCVFEGPKRDISTHFKDTHDINYEVENLEFDKWDTFITWKKQTEKRTRCKFILKRGGKKIKEKTIWYYGCHRSGYFKSKGKNIRLLKIQRSKKINGFCPASIDVTIHKDKCTAKFISTHIGHSNQLCHVNISPSKREEIAKQLQLKIPSSVVVSNIQNSINEAGLDRIHLVTKKDLHNISATFNISNEMRNSQDGTSVDILINELRAKPDHPIVYYKPQDTVDSENPVLNCSDFVAIFMNDAQKEMLMEYGKRIVCVDGTHGMGYDFVLYTILVLDKVNQGFPCAFLLTNRSDQTIYEFFFAKIKEKVGCLNVLTFMSDMELAFGNAWSNIMGKPNKQLFCTWHVVRAWKQNLNRIKGGEKKKKETYKLLRILLHESDENKFEILLTGVINRLKADKQTESYAEYFERNYKNNTSAWAYCFRKNSGLNSNTHLESLHRMLKYVYLEGKKVKRLDKTILILMKFIFDRLYDQIIIIHKGKLTKKIQDLRRRHCTAVNAPNLITYGEKDERWIVSSKQIYYVEKNNMQCQCELKCTLCKACIHKYTCSCLDYSIKWNMCKHVHQVCLLVNSIDPNTSDPNVADPPTHSPSSNQGCNLNINCGSSTTDSTVTDTITQVVLQNKAKEVSMEEVTTMCDEVLELVSQNKEYRQDLMKYLRQARLCIESKATLV